MDNNTAAKYVAAIFKIALKEVGIKDMVRSNGLSVVVTSGVGKTTVASVSLDGHIIITHDSDISGLLPLDDHDAIEASIKRAVVKFTKISEFYHKASKPIEKYRGKKTMAVSNTDNFRGFGHGFYMINDDLVGENIVDIAESLGDEVNASNPIMFAMRMHKVTIDKYKRIDTDNNLDNILALFAGCMKIENPAIELAPHEKMYGRSIEPLWQNSFDDYTLFLNDEDDITVCFTLMGQNYIYGRLRKDHEAYRTIFLEMTYFRSKIANSKSPLRQT